MTNQTDTRPFREVLAIICGTNTSKHYKDFWQDLCTGFGIIAAIPHPSGIEVLSDPTTWSFEGGSRVLDADWFHLQWIEFVIDADLMGGCTDVDDSERKGATPYAGIGLFHELVKIISQEPADPYVEAFWTEHCEDFGIVATVVHPLGLEVLMQPSTTWSEPLSATFDLKRLEMEWFEFIVDARLEGRFPDWDPSRR